ncbi:amidohydrolase [Paenibacillus glycanilyticus]|uniref:Deaminase n=1 Tax=Paenibacillus glycanilyticus TaxID=126569 RepID=A0ABQ6GC48_9BACL|nr:amidohydrolase [Paenibacillus glycanilyticus]GLX67161.1 deaminase [Paenibacillus glycanilyticus]
MNSYWLTNVRLEEGYQMEAGVPARTITGSYHLFIQDEKIRLIRPAGSGLPSDNYSCYDAEDSLMLPAFRDMHIHLDKTYYSGPWKAVEPPFSVLARIEEEAVLLHQLLPKSQERAEALIDLLFSHGTTYIRSHCNVDPYTGVKHVEAVMRAFDNRKDKVSGEIVVFPQHGLLRSQVVEYAREALRLGATSMGGVDPGSVDQNIEQSLYTIMDLAVEANADVDVHIHDPGHLGTFTIRRLADMAEDAGWRGRVTVSHALGLAGVSPQEQEELAAMLAARDITLTSTVPLGNFPFPVLKKHGVKVWLGDDSITDHWNPFGQGNVLEKASKLAERYGWSDERGLAETLGYITGGVTPLDRQGNQLWPKEGDAANAVLVRASCSAEMIARRSKVVGVLSKGSWYPLPEDERQNAL